MNYGTPLAGTARMVAGIRRLLLKWIRRAEVSCRRRMAIRLKTELRRFAETTYARGLRLHLGCGTVHLSNWINIDVRGAPGADVFWNLRYGFPSVNGAIDLVYSEHMIEHLRLDETCRLLSDLRLHLGPDGVVRIATPDLAVVVKNYLNNSWDQDLVGNTADAPAWSAAEYINFVFRAWGHQYLFDFPDLEMRLREAGFTRIVRCNLGESVHPDLAGLESRPESTLIVEAMA